MPDITELILDDHERMRRLFARLDDYRLPTAGTRPGTDPAVLRGVWEPLADLLDTHAAAEEEVFYPQLLTKGKGDTEEETDDAIGDHNDIRDGVRDARDAEIGSDAWWKGVDDARKANSEHLGEEEWGALADFRRSTGLELREQLGDAFVAFKGRHPHAADVDTEDKDPKAYIREHEG